MSNFHYLDKDQQSHGPVSAAEIERLDAQAKQEGWQLLVAVPGASGWVPYAAAAAASPAPASAPNPLQPARPAPIRPQPRPSAPAPAPASAPHPHPQPFPAPASANQPHSPAPHPAPAHPAPQPFPGAPPPHAFPVQPFPAPFPGAFPFSPPAPARQHVAAPPSWVVKVCYGFAIFFALVFVVHLAGGGVLLADLNAAASPAAGAPQPFPVSFGWLVFLLFLTSTNWLFLALLLVWAGKILGTLNDIAANTR
jgi:hypothetical protein